MAKPVPPLVRPLEAENAAVVRTRLDPTKFYPKARLAEEDGDDLFQAPAGALVWAAPPPTTGPGPGGEDQDILAVCFIEKDRLVPELLDPLPVPLGVVASPVEDPGLLHRHPDELAHLAVYVSGTHTIFAAEEDCVNLFPMAFIKADWSDDVADRLLDTGRGRKKFYVPRFTKVDSASDKGAFAMVLQSGKSELRILLLVQRFQQPRTVLGTDGSI